MLKGGFQSGSLNNFAKVAGNETRSAGISRTAGLGLGKGPKIAWNSNTHNMPTPRPSNNNNHENFNNETIIINNLMTIIIIEFNNADLHRI